MAKRKQFQHPQPPMKHGDKFEKYLPKSKRATISCSSKTNIGTTHCGFRLVNQLPLYRIDNNETVEIL